jgi:hypothetical protein
MLQELAIDQFLDRIVGMPDEEALLELRLRRERHFAELALLQSEKHDLLLSGRTKASARVKALGAAMLIVNTDLARLNEAVRETNVRLERTTWAKAVTAIFGQEGYDRCRLWMFQQNPERAGNFKGLPDLLAKYGLAERSTA